MIKLIVAFASNNVIGLNNTMPWHIREELQFFKATTINHHLMMGRSTFESIGKVLPNRTTHILTRKADFKIDNKDVVINHDALSLISEFKDSEEVLFIAGGASIYQQYYEYAQELYISMIPLDLEGDAFFPEINYNNYILNETKIFNEFKVYHYIKK